MNKQLAIVTGAEVKYGSEGCKWELITPKAVTQRISPEQFNKVMHDYHMIVRKRDAYSYFMKHIQE